MTHSTYRSWILFAPKHLSRSHDGVIAHFLSRWRITQRWRFNNKMSATARTPYRIFSCWIDRRCIIHNEYFKRTQWKQLQEEKTTRLAVSSIVLSIDVWVDYDTLYHLCLSRIWMSPAVLCGLGAIRPWEIGLYYKPGLFLLTVSCCSCHAHSVSLSWLENALIARFFPSSELSRACFLTKAPPFFPKRFVMPPFLFSSPREKGQSAKHKKVKS